MSHLNSTQIDEKIKFLDKQLKKTGIVLEAGPAMSTANIYQTFRYDFTPGLPEIEGYVPDSTGFSDGTSTQDANGGDESDSNTWENGWNNISDMQNSNDLNGETDRNISFTPDLSGWTPAAQSNKSSENPIGSGFGGVATWSISSGIGGGRTIGTLTAGNTYVGMVVPDNIFSTYNYPGYPRTNIVYAFYSDSEYAAAKNIADAYEDNKLKGSVTRKVWVPYHSATSHDGPTYDEYTGAKKTTTITDYNGNSVTKQWKLKSINILNGARQNYISQTKRLPSSSTTLLTQHSLDDPSFYAGNPNKFMDFLRGALDVGEKAFDWLADKAGETVNKQKDFEDQVLKDFGDKIRNLPSVKETDNKIDDAILGGLTLLNKILDPVSDAAEKFNNIVGPLAGGGGKVGLLKKSFQMAAGQIAGRLTTTFALPADNAITYNLQHAAALVSSIISGRGQEVEVTRKVQGQMLDALDPDKVKDILRIGPHTEIGSEKTIRPTEDKKGDIFNNGSAFGIIGGYEFSVDPEKGTYKIIAQKMLRTDKNNLVQTSGSDQWQDPTDAEGKITRFEDIPEIQDKDLTSLVDKLINEPGIVRSYIETQARLADKITGSGGTESSVYELIKNDPKALEDLQNDVAKHINNLKPGSKASNLVQGTASNSVYIRKVLTKLGFPESQAEKEGKGYGRVYTTVQGNVSDLSPELQDLINKKRNVKESYLSEGWESPKYTYVDKDQQKRWFKEKDIQPVYPKKAPPKMVKGWHPKFVVKLDTPIPIIKVSKKDLQKSHIFKPDEVEELMQLVKNLNDYIKRNPDHLAYARVRYPKHDTRLAALNYKLDMQLAAADEYVETRFPENERLFDRLMKRTKESIKLTDPKTYENDNGKLITFNKLARIGNDYQPRKIKVKKKPKMSQDKLFLLPDRKKKDDILKDKMAVLDNQMKKTMPDM